MIIPKANPRRRLNQWPTTATEGVNLKEKMSEIRRHSKNAELHHATSNTGKHALDKEELIWVVLLANRH